jgi:hypothetical protein
VADCCEHGNGPSGSIKGGEFLDRLKHCQLSNNESAARSSFYYSCSRMRLSPLVLQPQLGPLYQAGMIDGIIEHW